MYYEYGATVVLFCLTQTVRQQIHRLFTQLFPFKIDIKRSHSTNLEWQRMARTDSPGKLREARKLLNFLNTTIHFKRRKVSGLISNEMEFTLVFSNKLIILFGGQITTPLCQTLPLVNNNVTISTLHKQC